MTAALEIILWTSIGLVGVAYVGYPLAIYVASRLFGRQPVPPRNAVTASREWPKVSVLVSALNEEKMIAERIENNLAQDYPAERLEIVVASDGSTDRTASIVRDFAGRFPGRVRLLDYPVRRGKATVLNESIPPLPSEIIVLSDANTFFEPPAITRLVRWFDDPQVGVVCGKLLLVDPRSGKNVDSLYWRYENFLKACEGRLGALLGSNGAIYALRRESYVPIAGDTIIDDFMIPLLIRLRHGLQTVYDAEAIANEETPADVSAEFRRRSRIGAGGFQSLMRLWPLLSPAYGWTSFAFWSHKVLRWLCPAFMALALVCNLLLVAQPLYRWLLAAQVAFYLAAIVGNFVPGNHFAARLLRLTTLFLSMNLALAVGFWRWIAGRQGGTWQRTAR
jgi:cellulose synthase/poly-beta-1,6-N-acetylglucosamine synthase-like glycosyltransferase